MLVLAAPVDDFMDALTGWFYKWVISSALSSLQTNLTWWMSDSDYSLNLAGDSETGMLNLLREHTNFLTYIGAFAGFLVAAFRVAIQRRGGPFREALSQFVELVIIVFTLATAVNLASIAGDRYSAWILKSVAPESGDWTAAWTSGLNFYKGAGLSLLVVVFAAAALVSNLVQYTLMLFRSGILIILVGILPVLAASRFTSYGNRAYKRSLGWLASWILFKPTAATIYTAAEGLMQSNSQADRLFGLALVGGAIFTLPATLRAVMPAITEDNSFFSPRQVGHFMFGGGALNAVKGENLLTGSWAGVKRVRGNVHEARGLMNSLFGPGGGNTATGNDRGTPGAGTPGPGGSPGTGGSGPDGGPKAGGTSGANAAPGTSAGGGPGKAVGTSAGGEPRSSGRPRRVVRFSSPGGAAVWGGHRDAADGARGPVDGWEAEDFQAAVDANQMRITPSRESSGPSGNAGTVRDRDENAGPTGNPGT
ncbi:hypothetical protein ABZ806_30435 [Spirillospora sp. NPDC047418]